MKIAIINNLYPPYQKGGAETIAQEMAKKLETAGYDVLVISTSPQKSYKENNIYYLSSWYQKKLNKLQKLFFCITKFPNKEIKEILQKEKPDLVITHNLLGLGFRSAQTIAKLNIEHQHYLHDIQLLHPAGLMYSGREKIISSLPAKIYQKINSHYFQKTKLVTSPSVWLLKLHKERGFFQKAKTEIKKPQISLEKIEIIKDKNLILFVGQIEEHKGLGDLLEAFKDIPNKRLEIVGHGSQFEKYKNKYSKFQNIIFLGQLPRKETLQKISQATKIVVPSRCYENCPTVILEAQALETEVIASALGGIEELLEKENLFLPGNISKIKELIQR